MTKTNQIQKLLIKLCGFFLIVLLFTLFNSTLAIPDIEIAHGVGDTAILTITPNSELMICQAQETVIIALQDVADLYGYQIQLNYDEDLVLPKVTFDNTFFDTSVPGQTFAFITCNAGNCTIVASKLAPAEPISGGGPLVIVALEPISGSGGFYNMDLTNIVFSDIDGFQIPVESPTNPLAITVCGLAEVDGLIALEGRATPIDEGVVTLSNLEGTFPPQTTSFAASTGAFNFKEVPFLPESGSNYRIEAAHDLYLSNELEKTISSTSFITGQTMLLGGDADLNDVVDIIDLACIGGNFGNGGTTCGGNGSTNINGDMVTNIQDLAIAGKNFRMVSFLPW